MGIPLKRCDRVSARGTVVCLTLVAILAAAAPARAQYVEIQSFEVTPFVGARLGGTFAIQPDGAAQIEAALKDAASYGFAAGVRFDDPSSSSAGRRRRLANSCSSSSSASGRLCGSEHVLRPMTTTPAVGVAAGRRQRHKPQPCPMISTSGDGPMGMRPRRCRIPHVSFDV
jgi:hypothetical protein